MIDLDTHQIIDILADREAESVKNMMRFKQVQSARHAQDGREQGTEPTILDAFHQELGAPLILSWIWR
jgi:hypothetical protein